MYVNPPLHLNHHPLWPLLIFLLHWMVQFLWVCNDDMDAYKLELAETLMRFIQTLQGISCVCMRGWGGLIKSFSIWQAGHEIGQDVFRHLRVNICCRQPELWHNGNWALKHDCASAHNALKMSKFLTLNNAVIASHLPYFQIWLLATYFCFPKKLWSSDCSIRFKFKIHDKKAIANTTY